MKEKRNAHSKNNLRAKLKYAENYAKKRRKWRKTEQKKAISVPLPSDGGGWLVTANSTDMQSEFMCVCVCIYVLMADA